MALALLSFLRHICPLSAVVCSQVVRAMSFDSDIVVGFHLRLLFEMRLVVCGSLPEAGVRWSAVAQRVGSHTETLGARRPDPVEYNNSGDLLVPSSDPE